MLNDAPKRRGPAPGANQDEAKNENNHQDQNTNTGPENQARHLKTPPRKVGGGYSVEFFATVKPGQRGLIHSDCTWSPTLPTARDLRRKVDMVRYEAAKLEFTMMLTAALQGGGDDE